MVYLCQCLCPQRHALLGAVDEDSVKVESFVRATVEQMIAKHVLNPWCGICRAKQETWIYETAPSIFASMDEALPALEELQRRNLEANTLLSDSPIIRRPQG